MTREPNATAHKVYSCSYGACTQQYRTKFSLKRHYLDHLGIKQHQCPHCGKRFSLPQYLTEHMYTHTGEKPFACTYPGCNKRFRQAGKLSIHRKKHNLVEFSDASSDRSTKFGDSKCTLAEIEAVLTQIARFELPPFFYSKTLPHPGPHVCLDSIRPELHRDYLRYQQKLVAGDCKKARAIS